ncbi:hypothetical protein EHS25_008650 [Saitozyma podzolica]|uniref:Large ribosomal subunit protein mL54 n=1 Tax=Saitozyma podzolica TaxID=1890683 RepID=A0A427YMB5_9TREE|nr:hypothetical protein EHS25_008650 [Saitozyma podzolica]
MSLARSLVSPIVSRAQLARRIIAPVSASASASFSSSSSSLASSSASSSRPKATKRPVSSVPAGTVLSGLSILKDQPDPVALPDDQYPAWLWTILDEPKASATSSSAPEVGGVSAPKGSAEAGRQFEAEKKRLRDLGEAGLVWYGAGAGDGDGLRAKS